MTAIQDKKLYFVGGVVRDEILNAESFDIDYCYEGDAISFAKSKNLRIIKENPKFGTVRVLVDGKETDIASTRKETYPRAGHLPKVTDIGCPLAEDLKRRDFTINAMAKNTITGEILDFFGGLEDIKNKKIKVLHDKSFIDDPTRILRALKFAVRFNFELDETSKKLQEEYLKNINYDMSFHRLKKEIMETFNLNKGEAFDIFNKNKLYKLLGENQIPVNIRGSIIERIVKENDIAEPWIIYMSFFDLSNLALNRNEKRILEWTEKLKTQNKTDNTPKESIIIRKLLEKV